MNRNEQGYVNKTLFGDTEMWILSNFQVSQILLFFDFFFF
jgi:hypothetical protein